MLNALLTESTKLDIDPFHRVLAWPKIVAKSLFCAAFFAVCGNAPVAGQTMGAQAGDPYHLALTTAAQRLAGGRPIAAQWWLRRAYGHAKTPQQLATLREAFAIATDANPWTLNLSAGVAPSSNINGGAASDTFSLGEFQFVFGAANRALSGTEVSASGELAYRLAKGPRTATNIGISFFGRGYQLSDASKAAAPNASGSDYALVMADIFLRQEWVLAPDLGPTIVSLHRGRVDYGLAPLYSYHKLAAAQTYLLGQGRQLSLSVGYEDQDSQSASRADAQLFDGKAVLTLPQGQNLWQVSLGARKNASRLATDTYVETNFGLNFVPSWRFAGAQPRFSMGLGRKSYDEFILSLDGRRDALASLGVSLLYDRLAVLGFSPVVSITGIRTQSNVARYDTREVKASVTLQSRF